MAGGLLIAVFLIAALAFIATMFNGRTDQESIIEASHYAMQTVTMIGYGNWETAALPTTAYSAEARLAMRGYSVFCMDLALSCSPYSLRPWCRSSCLRTNTHF